MECGSQAHLGQSDPNRRLGLGWNMGPNHDEVNLIPTNGWGWDGTWVLTTMGSTQSQQKVGVKVGLDDPGVLFQPQEWILRDPSHRDAVFHMGASPIRASKGGGCPKEAPKRISPSALNICTPPNFPSKSTVLFRGLKARIIRSRRTSRQPGTGRGTAGEGGEGRGFHHPTTKWKREKSPPCKFGVQIVHSQERSG